MTTSQRLYANLAHMRRYDRKHLCKFDWLCVNPANHGFLDLLACLRVWCPRRGKNSYLPRGMPMCRSQMCYPKAVISPFSTCCVVFPRSSFQRPESYINSHWPIGFTLFKSRGWCLWTTVRSGQSGWGLWAYS